MDASMGLLAPRSGLYPTIGFDLQAGLQAGLAEQHAAVTLSVDNIGFAEKENAVYGQCEKMLLQGTKIIAAYINPSVAAHLQPLFEAAGGLLIVLDSGYHFPVHEGRLPNVIFLSLQGMLCCRMAAASLPEAPAAVAFAASYYDAGYRAPYVMSRAAEERGHRIDFHHITHLKRAEFSLTALQTWLNTAENAVILAAFCGDMSADFLEHLSRFEKRPAALYAGPYTAEETWLAKSVYPGFDFKACVPWTESLPLPANERFKAALKGRKPNIFSLLGYEAGQLAAKALRQAADGEAAALALAAEPLDSPRGTLRIDPETFQSQAPVYEVTVGQDDTTGKCGFLGAPRALPDVQQHWQSLQNDIASMRGVSSSNWLNAYPCIA